MAVDPECPESKGREPVSEVAVEDECRVRGCAHSREQVFELLLGQDVAANSVVDVLLPVDELGARDVAQFVRGRRVVVHFKDSYLRVGEMSGQLVSGDQDLRMCVFGHEEELQLLRARPCGTGPRGQ